MRTGANELASGNDTVAAGASLSCAVRSAASRPISRYTAFSRWRGIGHVPDERRLEQPLVRGVHGAGSGQGGQIGRALPVAVAAHAARHRTEHERSHHHRRQRADQQQQRLAVLRALSVTPHSAASSAGARAPRSDAGADRPARAAARVSAPGAA